MRNINLIASGALGFNFVELCIVAGIFALVLVVVFAVVMKLRKLIETDDSSKTQSALTIEQLEDMFGRGMISEGEFAAMRCDILDIDPPEEIFRGSDENENDKKDGI